MEEIKQKSHKKSWLGLLALFITLTGGGAFIGLILAIIALKSDKFEKTFATVALIFSIAILIPLLIIIFLQ